MTAGALEGDPVADGSETHRNDSGQSTPIDVDPYVRLQPALTIEVLHATQVPESFLSDHAHEKDVVVRLDAGFLERAQDGEHHDEAAGIVSDPGREQGIADLPDGDVGAFWKDRIEVTAEPDRAGARPAASKPDDVALGVGPDRIGAQLLEKLPEANASLLLHEGRCGDLGELDQALESPVVVRLREIEGGGNGRIRHQAPDLLRVCRLGILAEQRCREGCGHEHSEDRER